jgi:hypothetical protein
VGWENEVDVSWANEVIDLSAYTVMPGISPTYPTSRLAPQQYLNLTSCCRDRFLTANARRAVGLIDCHVHPLINEEDYQMSHLRQSSAVRLSALVDGGGRPTPHRDSRAARATV